MTVAELEDRMTSAELAEWMALDMYHEPIPSPWRQTGVLASAALAPYCGKGRRPKPEDFMPRARLAQSPEDMAAELRKLQTLTGGG